MKARMIYLVTLMMVMLAMSACSNEDIMDTKNLLTESVEVFEVDEFLSYWKKETSVKDTFYCFDDKEKLDQSGFKIDDAKLLNWRNRTLVIVHIAYTASLFEFSLKVYSKDGKYGIECIENYEGDIRNMALDEKCYGILLDKSNVSPSDINLTIDISGD